MTVEKLKLNRSVSKINRVASITNTFIMPKKHPEGSGYDFIFFRDPLTP